MFLSFANVFVDSYVEILWYLKHISPSKPVDTKASSVVSKPPESIPADSKTPSPLYALVIGIDNYKRYPLGGCVADAKEVKLYLQNELGVPESQIRYIENEQATRAKIIEEFNALQNDSRIQRDDPIVIFYAGHGGQTKAPEGWEAGGPKIQMLIPQDFFNIAGEPDRDVHGIPDRTIGALLDRLAKEKGDNITVIFDCCHSGSGARTNKIDPTLLVRGFEIKDPVPSNLDQAIWRGPGSERGAKIPPNFLQTGLRSHTLLAACGADETSKEDKGRGRFTKALLETLTAVGADKLTYSDVLHRMRALPEQNPQCEGVNQNRILFNSKAPSLGRFFYNVRMVDDDYILDAGAAHGITDGAEFAVYGDTNIVASASPLGTLVALNVDSFTTSMGLPPNAPKFELPQPAFALQTKAGAEQDLRLHVEMDEKFTGVFEALGKEMQRTGSQQRSILLVEKEADMDIAIEGNRVVFNISNALVTHYGLTRLPFTVPPNADDVYPVIRAMAHYNWHLQRTNKHPTVVNNVRITDNIQIEFKRLKQVKGKYDAELNPMIEPVGENLNVAGVVDLLVDDNDDAMYGIKLINNSSLPFYPSLFFFDNSDLSITSYYLPPTAGKGKVDPPLMPKESLTIGYGAGGAAPYTYFLRDGQDVDIGFLKLFLTTEQVDFSYIPQASPFDRDQRGQKPAETKSLSTWDTALVTIVQRRHAPKRVGRPS